MIDGVKLEFWSKTIIDTLGKLRVVIRIIVDKDTGVITKHEANYKSLWFEIFPSSRVEIRGSLHKYYKENNRSNFTRKELRRCIKQMEREFQFNASEVIVHNLEFGINIWTSFDPMKFCNAVIAHNKEVFEKMQSKGEHIGFVCERQQYIVKEYFKDKNLLRFEVKVRRMFFIKNIGIKVLSDLTKIDCLNKLGAKLNKIFADLIVMDEVNTDKLTTDELHIYKQCSNPKEWEELNVQRRCAYKKRFNKIIQQHGQMQWKKVVAKKIAKKWEWLSKM